MYPFTDKKVELSNSEVRGYKVFLLVKVTDTSLGCLFNYNLNDNKKQNMLVWIQGLFGQCLTSRQHKEVMTLFDQVILSRV